MLIATSSFERAARNLAARYQRRFPVGRQWDATSIKDRWYRRKTCEFVRLRLDDACIAALTSNALLRDIEPTSPAETIVCTTVDAITGEIIEFTEADIAAHRASRDTGLRPVTSDLDY